MEIPDLLVLSDRLVPLVLLARKDRLDLKE